MPTLIKVPLPHIIFPFPLTTVVTITTTPLIMFHLYSRPAGAACLVAKDANKSVVVDEAFFAPVAEYNACLDRFRAERVAIEGNCLPTIRECAFDIYGCC